MSIDRITLRLQSDSRTAYALSEIVGREPLRSSERGSPVSSKRPNGPSRMVSTAIFEWPASWRSLGEFVDELGEVLASIGEARSDADDFSVDLVVAITSRPLGYVVELGDAQLSLLASVRCGLVVDAYSSDERMEEESNG